MQPVNKKTTTSKTRRTHTLEKDKRRGARDSLR
jgi:hypothetical protein